MKVDMPLNKETKLNKTKHLGGNILSTESDVNICIGKAWTAINRLMAIWKSDLSNKIK